MTKKLLVLFLLVFAVACGDAAPTATTVPAQPTNTTAAAAPTNTTAAAAPTNTAAAPRATNTTAAAEPTNTSAPRPTNTRAAARPTNTTAAAEPTETEEADAEPTSSNADPTNTAVSDTDPIEGGEIAAIGETVEVGSLNVTLNSAEIVEGVQFFSPDPGYMFVAINATFENNSSADVAISSLLQMSLRDDAGNTYDLDISATAAANGDSMTTPDGNITANSSLTGQVGYSVPDNAQNLQWVYEDLLGSETVIFDTGLSGSGEGPAASGDPTAEGTPDAMSTVGPSEPTTDGTIYAIGESAEVGSFRITVDSVAEPAGDEFFQPEAGQKFVAVTVTVENIGTDQLPVSSLLQMGLVDAAGTVYNLDIPASVAANGDEGQTPDGDLAPGDTLTGTAGFSVPEDAEGLQFRFSEIFSDSGALFDLGL